MRSGLSLIYLSIYLGPKKKYLCSANLTNPTCSHRLCPFYSTFRKIKQTPTSRKILDETFLPNHIDFHYGLLIMV